MSSIKLSSTVLLMNGKYYSEYQGTCVNEAQQSGASHITQVDGLSILPTVQHVLYTGACIFVLSLMLYSNTEL